MKSLFKFWLSLCLAWVLSDVNCLIQKDGRRLQSTEEKEEENVMSILADIYIVKILNKILIYKLI